MKLLGERDEWYGSSHCAVSPSHFEAHALSENVGFNQLTTPLNMRYVETSRKCLTQYKVSMFYHWLIFEATNDNVIQ